MRRIILGVVIGTLTAGGSAAAASRWVITSTHQIKPSVLRHLRGERGRVGKVGRAGPQGPMGLIGPSGAPGAFSTANVTEVQGPPVTMCPNGDGSCDAAGSLAQCPVGSVVLGGGWDGASSPPVDATVAYDEPLGGSAWSVVMVNNSTSTLDDPTFQTYAVCATGSGSQARARSSTVVRQFAAEVASARAGR